MNDLSGKTIIVTGGLGLLGSSFVSAIRQAGARCVVADINCQNDLSSDEFALDITSEQSVTDFFDQLKSSGTSVDGWVNNAYPRTPDWGTVFEDIPFDSWRKNVDMHLNGYFLCAQRALAYMGDRQRGSLVSIGSIYGSNAPEFAVYEGTSMTMPAGYAAIKGGIINLTRYLAAYYGPKQVRVNCVSPGGIFDHQPASFVQRYEARVPLRRMGLPEDIAPVVVFLLSEDARYITGQNLMVDGGWGII